MTADVEIRFDGDKRQVQAWSGEKQVGRISVVPVSFDWGCGTIVPMAGIAGVGTDEDHRRLGIAGRMMQRAIAVSKDEGYPVGGVSTGHGNVVRRLYARSGYAYLFDVDLYEKALGTPECARPPGGVEVRPYAPGDGHGMRTLWARSYSQKGFFGGRHGDVSQWVAQRSEQLAADPRSVWVAVRDGAVVGWAEYYVHWFQRKRCALLVEEGAAGAAAASALLTNLERAMHDAGVERMSSSGGTPDRLFLLASPEPEHDLTSFLGASLRQALRQPVRSICLHQHGVQFDVAQHMPLCFPMSACQGRMIPSKLGEHALPRRFPVSGKDQLRICYGCKEGSE